MSFIIIALGEFVTSINEFIDISSLHHEIKNPLTAIEGVVQVIDSKYNDEYLKKCTDIIKRESNRIKYLLESVNILSDLKLNIKDINVKDFIKNIVDKFKIIYSGIDFYIYMDSSVQVINGDEEKLEMVFNNLIKNACEAKNVSVIEIKYEIDPTIKFFDKEKNVFKKMVKFSIKDNGIGIDKNIRDKIFTPFWTTKSKGSGLGLVISKEIIEKHYGKIEYKSIEGVGTTFSIYMPI
jgi:signal transduction histidine kinase